MSAWDKIESAGIHEARTETERDWVEVVWHLGRAIAVARVEQIDGWPRLVRLEVTAAPGQPVPETWRRLPTDAVLLKALMRSGPGSNAVSWLRLRAEPPSQAELVLSEELKRMRKDAKKHTRRPTSEQMKAEIEWMRKQLNSGLSTSELIADFRARFFCSEATAYRRLSDAREMAEEQEGTA